LDCTGGVVLVMGNLPLNIISMKAIVLKASGGVENLVLEDIAVPAIKDDEVLVKVKALSINPVDATLRKNDDFLRLVMHLGKDDQPVILGWDISGVVERVGKAVTGFRTGDEVFGMVNFTGHGKAYAEYVAAPESHLALKPSTISHEEAAAATLAPLTAWQTLVSEARAAVEVIHRLGVAQEAGIPAGGFDPALQPGESRFPLPTDWRPHRTTRIACGAPRCSAAAPAPNRPAAWSPALR